MATVINLDDAAEINLTAHEGQICSITFTLSDGDAWSVSGKIKVGQNYSYAPLKTYVIGDGLTINGQELIWAFNPDDWGDGSVVYDAQLVRVANAQRDFYGRITVNKSFE